MPFPFLIPIIVAGISVAMGALTVTYWDDIKIFFKGKNITILGAIETGKTTLHKYLREGVIVTEHDATKRKTTVEKNYYKLGELELLIKEGTDISGQQDFLKDWKEIFRTCDICFYMFDTSKIYNGDKEYIEKIYFHLTHMDNWKKEFKINPYLIMIGGFADKIPEYHTLNKSNIQLFEQKIREKIKPAFLQASISPSDIFIGSLLNKTNIETLMSEVLIRISNK
jgi:GTPase SAR1 family protein